MKIIRINKDGSMNELDLKITKNPITILNKNKVSSGNDKLKELYMWKYDSKTVKCYGWYDGDAGFENKHELAPNGSSSFLEEDSSSQLLFGDIFIVVLDSNNKYHDFTVSDYGMFFEIMNEGFDDVDDDDDDGYHQEVFSEDEDYNNDDSSDDDINVDSSECSDNELLDTDNNIY